jgi:hypothetical protein
MIQSYRQFFDSDLVAALIAMVVQLIERSLTFSIWLTEVTDK